MRKILQRAAAAAFVSLVIAACGARSELLVPEREECVSLSATAPIADLDVFTMMDASGSMDYATADGPTKWQAVRSALAAFYLDAGSQGIGAALSFFPLIDPDVPQMCADNAACGTPDDCTKYKVCLPDGGDFCDVDADCAAAGFPGDTCQKLGFCELDTDQACLPDQGTGCDDFQGACLDLGLCENHYDCDLQAYVPPAVNVATLPGGAQALLKAIDARVPDGGTPTLPALSGAITEARLWTQANPGHKAIVVLATDGLPKNCDPALKDDDSALAIQHLVEVAAQGVENGVQTFVIGVFNADEAAEAAPNLDAIAKGGGTDAAFVISTEENVTSRFLEALNQVRITSKSCEFGIPLVDGKLPDLKRMTVRITPPGGASVKVDRRGSADECDATTGGFYYDTPVDSDPPPGRVILCPASCDLFGATTNRVVDLQVSCD